jgi:hypothetical protein
MRDAIPDGMNHEKSDEAAKPRQTMRQRLFWFFVGAGVNYLLIATPFKFIDKETDWPVWAVAACSVGVSTTFFFFWNYFVNFRTDSRKRDAFVRYVTAVIILWAMGTSILTFFKSFDSHVVFNLGKFSLDLDVIATQACLGWLKFIVYHKWAFPVAKADPAER